MFRSHHLVRVAGMATIVGSLLGLLVEIVLGRDWGAPGTTQYESYEFANRLLSLPLVLMASGLIGLYIRHHAQLRRLGTTGIVVTFVGFVLMVVGNIAEFFVFTSQPYMAGFNGRNAAWMTFGLGIVAVGIGGLVLGIATWRRHALPRWTSLLVALYLPLSIMAFSLGYLVLGICLVSLGLGWRLLMEPPEHTSIAV